MIINVNINVTPAKYCGGRFGTTLRRGHYCSSRYEIGEENMVTPAAAPTHPPGGGGCRYRQRGHRRGHRRGVMYAPVI